MLTLKAPVELICNTSISPSYEAFYHRITGNYEVMASGITAEDLFHVMTAPPEIYLGEGGMTSLVNNIRISNRQETKLELINNLLNRIVLNEDVNLTYQDRVYITEVLNKLGIRDVRQFMRQVNLLKQETNDTQQLISAYWNNLQELTEKVQEYQNLYEEEHKEIENIEETMRLYLHENILSRLQTGAIYQILNNFYAGYSGSAWYVSGPEFQITEQKRVASNILLNQLESVIQGEDVPFVYRHENYYESLELEQIQKDESFINEQIASAVLLNLIDNLYFNRFEKQQHDHESWLRMEDALYQTAENTIWRLQTGLTSIRNIQENKEEMSQHQHRYRQELSLVYQILRGEEPGEEYQQREIPVSGTLLQDQIIRQEQVDITNLTKLEAEENQMDLTLQQSDTELLQEEIQRIDQQNIENYNRYQQMMARQLEMIRKEQTDITNLTQLGTEENKTDLMLQQSDTELLQEEIQRINQQNIENYNRYQQMMARQLEMKRPRAEDSRARMRQESLMALRDSAGLLQEYREEAQKRQEQSNSRVQSMLKLLPEQTRRIYETLAQYQADPGAVSPDVAVSRNNLGLLLRDIQTVEQNREQELTQILESRQSEQVQTENVIERWKGQTATHKTAEQSRVEAVENDISLIHRSMDNQVNEEMLEELITQNRLLSRKNEVTEKEETTTQVVNRTIYQQGTDQQTLFQEREDISELIREGVHRQMNALSEQVYNKLEKRLQNEKRRRGY